MQKNDGENVALSAYRNDNNKFKGALYLKMQERA